MLGFFPDPYQDELLYSACARFSDRMKFPDKSRAAREWFGRHATAIVDLPGRLKFLIAHLPPGHRYTIDRLIYEHTLLPFYAPFVSLERLQSSKEDMRSARVNRVHARLGIKAGRLKSPEHLRFCHSCVIDDRERYGEIYWHRIHQVTGVVMCPQHRTPLTTSDVLWNDRRCPSSVSSAESAINRCASRPLKIPNTYQTLLLKIASDAAWLLSQQYLNYSPEILRHRYFNLLLSRGYAFYNGKIRSGHLLRDFVNLFPPPLLDSLQCSINSQSHNWVTRLVMKDRSTVVQHPLRHLLLMTFLGYTAEEFLTHFAEYKPFGDGPWPCLNHASGHFGQLKVAECRVVDSLIKGKRKRPMGIFSCACGFAYTRMGPDISEEVRTRVDSVRAYGHIWEDTLRQLWQDRTITIREIACTLGVYEATVVRRAIQLGLQYPRDLSKAKSPIKISKRYLMSRKGLLDTLGDRRREWLSFMEAYPNASRRQLIRASRYLYLWLRRNDLEWFEAHLPPVRKSVRRTSLLDWDIVDMQLSTSVKASAVRIKSLPGRPIRVSITAVIKEVGSRSWLEKSLAKLPLTAKVINEHVESPEAFAIRKVLWAEECYMLDRITPTRFQLIIRAGVKNKSGETSQVQSVIDAAIERLSKLIR